MKDKKSPKRCVTWRLFGLLIVRLIVLAAIVVGYALPMPWKIIVPLTIGSVTIIIETFACFKNR